MSSVVVIDNGAYTAKCGISSDKQARVVPNCVIKAKNVRSRMFIGDQIDECKDMSALFYLLSFQKGYIVNWDYQRQVWDRIFKNVLKKSTAGAELIITEPCFNFTSVQENMTEIFFEDYQISSIFRCNASLLSEYKARSGVGKGEKCCLVIDSGYSFTHIVPYCQGVKQTAAIRRINVGGKILTNHLKEVISYRQLMVMDETHVMNQCKEDVCFMSHDFWKDMETAKQRGKDNTIVCDYVLPDYTHIKRGQMRPVEEGKASKGAEQTIRLNNERFAIPEILMHPSDVGIQEMGIPETIINSVSSLSLEMQPHMYEVT